MRPRLQRRHAVWCLVGWGHWTPAKPEPRLARARLGSWLQAATCFAAVLEGCCRVRGPSGSRGAACHLMQRARERIGVLYGGGGGKTRTCRSTLHCLMSCYCSRRVVHRACVRTRVGEWHARSRCPCGLHMCLLLQGGLGHDEASAMPASRRSLPPWSTPYGRRRKDTPTRHRHRWTRNVSQEALAPVTAPPVEAAAARHAQGQRAWPPRLCRSCCASGCSRACR